MTCKSPIALFLLATVATVVSSELSPEELATAAASDDVCQGIDEGQCSLELRQLRAEQRTAEVQAHEQQEELTLLSVQTSHVLDVKGEPSLALEQEEEAKGDCIKCDVGTGCKLTWLNVYKKCPTNAPYYSLSKDICSNSPSCSAGRPTNGPAPSPYSPAKPSNHAPAPSPSGKYGKCETATGGTCNIMGCAKSRGKGVQCVKGKCVCKTGYCSNSKKNGMCKTHALLEQEEAELQARNERMWQETTWQDVIEEEGLAEVVANVTKAYDEGACDDDTYGSCSIFSCSASRGATDCVHGKCKCPRGYCAKGGACFAQQGNCLSDTAGTCSLLSCAKSRGATKCKSGKCMCQMGTCAWKGKCFPDTDTGGSCNILGCGSSRGPTVCHKGRCLCQSGYVAIQGRCERAMFS